MAGGSLCREARLPSSKRLSKQACLELPRRIRSQQTQIITRQVECSCASTSSVIFAQWMPLLRSLPVGSALKSGHYFYEPLVSGGNLLGVWVLPEDYPKKRDTW